MKRAITIILALVMVLSLAACGGTNAPTPTESRVEQIERALQGTWRAELPNGNYTFYTFYDGKMLAELYVNGKKIENVQHCDYRIGTEAIYTVTTDQDNIVEGHIPFTFVDGILTLYPLNDAIITKVE